MKYTRISWEIGGSADVERFDAESDEDAKAKAEEWLRAQAVRGGLGAGRIDLDYVLVFPSSALVAIDFDAIKTEAERAYEERRRPEIERHQRAEYERLWAKVGFRS